MDNGEILGLALKEDLFLNLMSDYPEEDIQ